MNTKIRPQAAAPWLILGLALVAAFVLGFQEDPTTRFRQPVETSSEPVNIAPVQRWEGTSEPFSLTVKKVAPAVVRIVTSLKTDSLTDFAGGIENPHPGSFSGQVPGAQPHRPVQRGLGSGVIVTEDGYILTNTHLVAGEEGVEVTLKDGRQFQAKVIGIDPKTDIAVLKIDGQHLPSVPLAESRDVQVGDPVLAFGYPFGLGQTVTHGIISATDRVGIGTEDCESFIQTDAPINPGNSGGALVDVTGHLIGINAAILSSSGGNLGIGFAVPSDLARRVMSDLVNYGYVVRGYLGVETQDLTPEFAKEFRVGGAAGVLVGGVVSHGPAEKAGLLIGDVITRFDGKQVCDTCQLKLSIAEAKPGQTVPVEVLRDGSARPLQVTVGLAPNNDLLAEADRTAYEREAITLQGVIVGELNSELRQQLKIPRNVQGALVFGVSPFSLAAQAGLRPGDVIESINRQDARNAGEASQLAQAAGNKRMLLRVWRNGGSHFILVGESQPR